MEEEDEIIYGLTEFFHEADKVHTKWYDKEITSDQAMKEIEELVCKYYKYYSKSVYGV